jgi:hypothetical protein
MKSKGLTTNGDGRNSMRDLFNLVVETHTVADYRRSKPLTGGPF